MVSLIRSPLTYPGAKGNAMKYIAPLIPKFKEYRECFLGGGSVYLFVRQTYGNNKIYWINDLYGKLYNFWKQTQQYPDDMIKYMLTWKNEYEDQNGKLLQRFLRDSACRFGNTQKAAAYYTWNQTSFSGFGRGFSKSNYDKKFNEDRINGLKDISSLLQGTRITNLDYSKLIEMEPTNGIDNNDVFIFLDPPYQSVEWPELYGSDGNLHKYFDHNRFAETMRKCKYPFLITYDDSPFIRKLFDWTNIMPFEFTYTSRKIKMGKELLISNMEFEDIKHKNRKQQTMDDYI
jgi:DNA adenine methylase